MRSLYTEENPFKAAQGAALDSHLITDFYEGPWLVGKSGCDQGLYRIDFRFIYGHRHTTVADDLCYARGCEDRQSVLNVQAAEYVARE